MSDRGCANRPHRVSLRRAVVLAAGTALGASAWLPAATIEWDGGPAGRGTYLNDPVNWAGDTVPRSTDDAVVGFVSTVPSSLAVTGNFGVGSLTIDAGPACSSLNGGELTLYGTGAAQPLLSLGSSHSNTTFSLFPRIVLRNDARVHVANASATLDLKGGFGEGGGPFELIKTGLGTLALESAVYSLSGGINVVQGTLRANPQYLGGDPLSSLYAISVHRGATLHLRGSSADAAVGRGIVLNGDGIGGAASLVLESTTSDLVLANPISLLNDSTISVIGSRPAVLQKPIGEVGGPRALIKAGSGTLSLRGGSSYQGSTIINGGTLELDDTAPSASSAFVVNRGASLALVSSSSDPNANCIDNAPITLAGGALVAKGGNAGSRYYEQVGLLTLASGMAGVRVVGSGPVGTLTIGSFSRAPGTIAYFSGYKLGEASGSQILFAAPPTDQLIGGGGPMDSPTASILPYGWSEQSLEPFSPLVPTFVTYGPHGIRLLSNYSSLAEAVPTSNVIANNVSLNADKTINSLLVSGNLIGPGKLTIASGAVLLRGSATINTPQILFSNDGYITAPYQKMVATIQSVIAGPKGLTLSGSGEFHLLAANTFGGPGQSVTINRSKLTIPSDASLGHRENHVVLADGAELVCSRLTTARSVHLNPGRAMISAGVAEFSGAISGPGELLLSSHGTYRFYGDNTYSGGTRLQDGIFFLGADHALGSGPVQLGPPPEASSTGVLLQFDGSRTLPNAITVQQALSVIGPSRANTLSLTGPVEFRPSSAPYPALSPSLTIRNATLRMDGPVSGAVDLNQGDLIVTRSNPDLSINLNGGSLGLGGSFARLSTGSYTQSRLRAVGAGPLTLGSSINLRGHLTIEGEQNLTLAGPLTMAAAATTLTKTSTGTLTISGPISLASSGCLTLLEGTTYLNSSVAKPGLLGLAVSVSNDAILRINAPQQFASLALKDASAALAADGQTLLRTSSLSLDSLSTLDLADNALIVESDPAKRHEVLDNVTALVRHARGSAPTLWQSAGITSSAAAQNRLAGLAVVLNDKGNGTPILNELAGQNVGPDDILVRYTWNGDVNLDGVIDAADYFLVDSGYITQKGGYRNGDLNFDDAVDAADYFLIDSAYIGQWGSSLDASHAAAVPEPASVALLALGAAGLLGRRR